MAKLDAATLTINIGDHEQFREYLMKERRALLMKLDAIEEFLGIERTSEIRKRDAAHQWEGKKPPVQEIGGGG